MRIARTVLVLGAGASKPYGFPLGKELKQIASNLLGSGTTNHPILGNLEFPAPIIEQFKRTLRDSRALTIDEVLERKPQFRDIGAQLIASVIAGSENRSNLFPQNDWCAELYQKLQFEANAPYEPDISVVTFNYDRSLEYFLEHAIEVDCHHSYVPKAHNKRSAIKIVHPHGSLGNYPEIPYPIDVNDAQAMQRAAACVRIPSDDLEQYKEMLEAQDLIANADRIVFLGFGYHESVLRRLFAKANPGMLVCGTAMGMDPKSLTILRSLAGNRADFGSATEDARTYFSKVDLVRLI